MSEGIDYILDNSSDTFRAALKAESDGKYQHAYKLFGELWMSDVWREDRDLLLHYANVSEKVADYTLALKLYTKLMQIMTLNPADTMGTLIQASMTRLNDLVHDASTEVSIETDSLPVVYDGEESDIVNKLFSFATEITLPAGATICHVDDIANHMWLLVDGEVDVIVSNINVSTLVGNKENPCLMGEVSYFTGMRRTATLQCKTEVRLLELSFMEIIDMKAKNASIGPLLDILFRNRLGYHILSQHDFFKRLDDEDLRKIALSFEHVSCPASKIIIEQGFPRNSTFMVQSGTLLLLKKKDSDQFELISSMHPGDIFHVGGLIKDYPSPYRVVAGTPCNMLRLRSKHFEPVLQKYPQLVKKIIQYSREEAERTIVHPENANLWAADRYIKTMG